MSIRDRDKIIWHPFTQEKTALDSICIKSGKGPYLYDENGKEYLDLISSWWVNLHGHANEEIAKAIYDQALKLEHVIFAGFTHEPAIVLCESLKRILPEALSSFFFSDNGSTAVEVAIKMSYQYWSNLGEKDRKLFLSFEGGYHGDTFGAMSVGVKSGFHSVFKSLCFETLTLPYPYTWDHDLEIEDKEKYSFEVLDGYLERYKGKIAAIIIEPLIQGASGMRVCRPSFIKKITEIMQDNGILVIFDEVMTGFGRTGTMFALSQIGVVPDFLCLSKGITGGFLPLAMTVTTDKIRSAFFNDEWRYAFAHGHSYTANPLACASAIASLNILNSDECQKSIHRINEIHRNGLSYLRSRISNAINYRILGTISAFDIYDKAYTNKDLQERFRKYGMILRPLGNTLYILPPYCINSSDLENAYDKIALVLEA